MVGDVDSDVEIEDDCIKDNDTEKGKTLNVNNV